MRAILMINNIRKVAHKQENRIRARVNVVNYQICLIKGCKMNIGQLINKSLKANIKIVDFILY